MADVWVLQNSDNSIVGVFGTKGASSRGGGDELSRAFPFDIIEPKVGMGTPQVVEVPFRVEVPVTVEVPVYIPSDNADGTFLLSALNDIQNMLTNAKAPDKILEAIESIARPAIDEYNKSAIAPPLPNFLDAEALTHEEPETAREIIQDDDIAADDALDFLLGNSDEASSIPEFEPEAIADNVVAEYQPEPEPEPEPDLSAPEIEFSPPNFYPSPQNEENVDELPAPISSFGRSKDTGLGDIVSPMGDPNDNPALSDNVVGLSSWLISDQIVEQEVPQTRREAIAREAEQTTGETSQSVII